MSHVVGVLGAGPHGHEIAALLPHTEMYDDCLDGYPPVAWCAHPYVVGAAWPRVRRVIADKATGVPWHGDGVVLFPGSRVSPYADLGEHTHIGYNAVVSHGCHVGHFVTLCAGVVLGGEVEVADDVFVGANATVIHGGIKIGQGAIIGAGAVVTRDVPAHATVMGAPARARALSVARER